MGKIVCGVKNRYLIKKMGKIVSYLSI